MIATHATQADRAWMRLTGKRAGRTTRGIERFAGKRKPPPPPAWVAHSGAAGRCGAREALPRYPLRHWMAAVIVWRELCGEAA